jgi:Kef-type K+ transport system membrane component KefB
MALAVCLVPSSTGVALTVLRRAKCFNTITGQLVVASTALCDIIALVCISELRALKHPSAVAFATPICAAIAYVLGVGAAAVYLVPPALQWLLLRVPPRLLEKTALSALGAVTAGLCAGLEHGGSSYLLGAFLAGVCFCTLPSITHAWERQVKRLQTWMLRIFFGCTIGFDVPIRKFREPVVLALAAALLLPLAGKAATGVLAKPRDASHVLTARLRACRALRVASAHAAPPASWRAGCLQHDHSGRAGVRRRSRRPSRAARHVFGGYLQQRSAFVSA